jgi:hypothetical protein
MHVRQCEPETNSTSHILKIPTADFGEQKNGRTPETTEWTLENKEKRKEEREPMITRTYMSSTQDRQ